MSKLREGRVTHRKRPGEVAGVAFEGSVFEFEAWKPEYRPCSWTACTFLDGVIIRPTRAGGPVLINLVAHDLRSER